MKKKWISLLFVLPLVFASIFMLSSCSCSEERVSFIALSLSGQDVTQTGKNTWTVIKRNKPYQVNVEISPSKYSAEDLVWKCAPSNVASITSHGSLSAKGEGWAEVSAQYKNSDGNVVYCAIRVYVSETQLPSYAQSDINLTYEGQNLVGSEQGAGLVPSNMSENYLCKYYEISNVNGKKVVAETSEILNAGEYVVECVSKVSGLTVCSLNVHVQPASIPTLISVPNVQTTYGDETFGEVYARDDEVSFEGGTSLFGVGVDSTREIGKCVFVSAAGYASGAGLFDVASQIKFSTEQDQKNYKFVYTKGVHTISPRKLAVKILNKNVLYGEATGNIEYELFDGKAYEDNGKSFVGISQISSGIVSYANNVTLSKYLLKIGNDTVAKNEFGQYDVLWTEGEVSEYDLVATFASSGNVQMDYIVPGKMKISPKEITVTPTSRSKIFGERDGEKYYVGSYSAGVVDEREIVPFLKVNYNSTQPLGEGNELAPVGTYYYSVDTTKNKNYAFVLCADAKPTAMGARIVFEVTPVEVELQFKDLTGVYYQATENIGLGGDGYILDKVESLKVSGKVIAENKDVAEVFENGKLQLVAGDQMEFRFRLDEVANSDKNGYKKFKLALREYTFADALSKKENYRVTLKDSFVVTKREKLTVKPCIKPYFEDGYNATKSYDGASAVIDEQLYKSFVISGNFLNGETAADVLPQDCKLLTLQKDGKFVKVLSSGEILVDEMKNCGRYKIMLDEQVAVKEGMEHYELTLDLSQNYCFEIVPKQVHVTLNTTNVALIDGKEYPFVSKTYGQDDPTFDFKTLDEVDVAGTGVLSRTRSGKESEVVGNYALTLGSVSLGENYAVVLDACYLVISSRKVLVTPTSPVVTYGADVALNQHTYAVQKDVPFDESLTTAPTFAGMFALQKNGTNVVKNTCYKAGIYDIVQGTFECTSSNYQMTFVGGATYCVAAKKTVLDILPVSNADKNSTPIQNATLSNSQLKLRQSVGNVTLSALVERFKDGTDNYYVESKADITLRVLLDGEDVSDCYEWTLGRSVAYYFGKSVIEVRVVKKGENVSAATTVYSGEGVDNLFELVCVSENYSISAKSNVTFYYIDEQGTVLSTAPVNAGSYSVVPKVSVDNKLVIEYVVAGETKTVEFSELPQTSNLFVARLQEEGLLTISKAEISVASDKVQFENSITYGTSALPDILLEYMDGVIKKHVFTVTESGEIKEVALKQFEGKHYRIVEGVEDVSSLNVGTYQYSLIVQPESANFNPASIYATLSVVAKEVKLAGGSAQLPENLTYDGTTKNCIVTPNFDMENVPYIMSYRYLKLKAENVDGVDIKLKVFDCANGVINLESSSILDASAISSAANEVTYSLVTAEGVSYVVLGGTKAVELAQGSATPQGAGVYLCIASITADGNNYLITRSGGNCEVAFLYEIKKNGNLNFTFKNSEFFYGTNFNLIDQGRDDFPFACDVLPNVGNSIQYIAGDDWGSNDILNVGTYQVKVKVSTSNFYKEEMFDFSVKPCVAEIEFPQTNSYAYTGYKIDSFFSNIKIKLYNHKGEVAFVTTLAAALEDEDFLSNCPIQTTFFQFDEVAGEYNINVTENKQTDLAGSESSTPVLVGKYLLVLAVGGEKANYYGTGNYEYALVKPAYSGEMSVVTKTITYDPNISPLGLYNIIRYGDEAKLTTKNGMFRIDLTESQYTLKIYVKDTYGNDVELNKDIASDDENNWVKYVMTCENGGVDLKFVVKFDEDLNFADAEVTRKLAVSQRTISKDYFSAPTGVDGYYYNGREVYHSLSYKGFASLDKVTEQEGTKIFVNGNDKVSVQNINYEDCVYAVQLFDKLGNVIGIVGFKYYKDDVSLGHCPIIPGEKYEVEYIISINGTNYTGSDDINPKPSESWTSGFRINKINLSIQIEKKTKEYSGNTFSLADFALEDKDLTADKIKVTVSSPNSTNLKVTMVPCGEAYVSNIAAGTSDIVVLVRLISGSTNIPLVQNGSTLILNKGEYLIQVSLLKSNVYDIKTFFNEITFYDQNGAYKVYSAAEIVSAGGDKDGMYNLCATQTLTITAVKFRHDTLQDLIKANVQGDDGKPVAVVKQNGVEYSYRNGKYILGEKDMDASFESDNLLVLDKNTTIEISEEYKDIYNIEFYQADVNWEIVGATAYSSIQDLIKALQGEPKDAIVRDNYIVKFVPKADDVAQNYAESAQLKFYRKKLCPWEVDVNKYELVEERGGIKEEIWKAYNDDENNPLINGDSARISTPLTDPNVSYIVKRVKFYSETGDRRFVSNCYRTKADDDTQEQELVDVFMLLFRYSEEEVFEGDGRVIKKYVEYVGYADDETKDGVTVKNGQFCKDFTVTGGTENSVEYFIVLGASNIDRNYDYSFNLSIGVVKT